MKQLLMEYNSSRDDLKEETRCLFQQFSLDLLKRQDTFNLEHETEPTHIPGSIKRHAIEMLNLSKRSKEKEILSHDMKQMFHYYRDDEAKVSNSIVMISSNDKLSWYEVGALAFESRAKNSPKTCSAHTRIICKLRRTSRSQLFICSR